MLLSIVTTISTGCSTAATLANTKQSLSFQTVQLDGRDVVDVKCDMTNDAGSWSVVTPNTVEVRRSNQDLNVTCTKQDVSTGTANVVSSVRAIVFGNILIGGVVGLTVDHAAGTMYSYPDMIKIVMGLTDQKIVDNSAAASPQTDK